MTPEQNIIFDELEQKAQGKTALLDTKKNLQRISELFGLYFLNQGRVHEAIPLFYGLYDRLLDRQDWPPHQDGRRR